ncbi:MAG: sigma-70 family RNA polymerase sigma factor [Flavobacteriaceae bacterium]|nr:sigma-70 family RNA polymerase sigma factor [Flavobacteriaceae bacterium]
MNILLKETCDEAVFTRIYKELEQSLWSFAYFKSGDPAHADDLTQNAFIKLWQNCLKVPPEKAKSFLFTVANNTFLNQVTHQKVVLKHAKLEIRKVEHEHPEFKLEEKQFLQQVQAALADLTEGQRTAFLMNRVEGKTYREIAEVLEISVKAVEKRMSLALASLRKEINIK